MKKVKFFAIVGLIISASFTTSCGKNSKEHIEKVKEETKDAAEEAKAKASADWQKFKTESEKEIVIMESQAKDLGNKIAEASNEEKIKLNKTLDKLNQEIADQKEKLAKKNEEFEAKISELNDSIAAETESFKRKFKKDSKELSNAIKDFFKDKDEAK